MVVIHYDKLVRDKIPQILDGKNVEYSSSTIVNKDEFHQRLAEKLVEEAKEYQSSKSKEELADIIELLDCLFKIHDTSINEMMTIQEIKRGNRGGYDNRILLEWTKE